MIGEAIDALGTLLDRFYEQHGEDLASRLEELLPRHASNFGAPAARVIYAFAASLEPVED